MSTIFTKIINGEIPSYKIYEDAYSFAFLDINPMQEGHTLVVSKKEIDYLFDLENEDYKNLLDSSRKVAKILKDKLGSKRICLVVEGYAIPHAHIHLIPTNSAEDFDKKHVHKATEDELEETYRKIVS